MQAAGDLDGLPDSIREPPTGSRMPLKSGSNYLCRHTLPTFCTVIGDTPQLLGNDPNARSPRHRQSGLDAHPRTEGSSRRSGADRIRVPILQLRDQRVLARANRVQEGRLIKQCLGTA
jgi:hypothetical protein